MFFRPCKCGAPVTACPTHRPRILRHHQAALTKKARSRHLIQQCWTRQRLQATVDVAGDESRNRPADELKGTW
jgi:hypothetical protein